jgi:hypothetical protein
LTKALQHAGFRLLNRYVVHSENPASVHILDRQFCEDCATALGWTLDAGLSGAEIDDVWGSLLG